MGRSEAIRRQEAHLFPQMNNFRESLSRFNPKSKTSAAFIKLRLFAV
jgi:hypothetical protein